MIRSFSSVVPNEVLQRTRPAGYSVGGYDCPQTGTVANSNIPSDNRYYLTSFGGPNDPGSNGTMACGGPPADGNWYYIADATRFHCGTKVQITNPQTGHFVVAQVADVGPNICVEQAANMPVIDGSPLISQYLFGTNSSGYADQRVVVATVVDPSTPLGPDVPQAPQGGTTQAGIDFTPWLAVSAVVGGGYLILRALKVVK